MKTSWTPVGLLSYNAIKTKSNSRSKYVVTDLHRNSRIVTVLAVYHREHMYTDALSLLGVVTQQVDFR